PALPAEQLDKRLQRDFSQFSRRQFKNSLSDLLPAKMIDVIVDLSHIDPEKPVHQITKEERGRLLHLLQHLSFTITATRPIGEAIVTAGGVHTKEINPKTMESRLVPGLYFAGEVIDIDGYTGGFNLQAAFSTGFVAGRAAAGGE
ncbi:MAG: NAD(P)/FAD-dependent oxidoreductase, partial [Negativicutes bacterium]|nr:NAD(P)/FAD-dependent oxidoreductase [Negativicutes bacterium]